jgi:hypothetical protein
MKRIKVVSAIFLSFVLLSSTLFVFGADMLKNISVTYRNITIHVNGKVVPSEQEPFIYQGRTFVPLRTIGEALSKKVEWDNNKNQITISDIVKTNPYIKLDSFYGLFHYFPDHYQVVPSNEKPTSEDIVKYEEFISKWYGKGKVSVNNEFFKSYLLKSTEDDILVFIFSSTSNWSVIYPILICLKFKDGISYCMNCTDPAGGQNRVFILGATDGWRAKISNYKEYNGNNNEITEEKLYINYYFDIEQSIADNPLINRTKEITDIYSAYIWFIRYVYYK